MPDTEQMRHPAFAKSGQAEESIPISSHIDRQGGTVMIDFGGCDSRGVSDIYQAFALLCAREEVRRALPRAGNEDPDAHFALRDTLVTLARIAGIPLRFKLALVAGSTRIEGVYRNAQSELRTLGCEAQVFRTERNAGRWLFGDAEAPAQAPRSEAALT